MMDEGEHEAELDIKPECVISSGYDPIKSEETDDEDMYKDTNNTSNSHQNIDIKEESVKEEDEVSTDNEQQRSPEYVISSSGYDPVKNEETDDEELSDKDTDTSNVQPINIKEERDINKVKAEDDISTDDEQYRPECVISSSGYDPVKSEETDDEDTDDEHTNNTSNRQQPNKVKSEAKTEDDVSTDEYGSEMKEPAPVQPNASSQESMDIQHTRRKKRYSGKRKRIVEERNGYVQKAVRIECSVEGCTRKAAGNGRCRIDHGGRNLCSEEGCTKVAKKGGVCISHGAVIQNKTCKQEGCTNIVVNRGVCVKHGAVMKKAQIQKSDGTCYVEGCYRKAADSGTCFVKHKGYKHCKEEGCAKQAKKGGVCVKHGAKKVRKKCKEEGCTSLSRKGGVCIKHGAVVKTCKHEGCTMTAQKGGVCVKHGAKIERKTCSYDGCTSLSRTGGVCVKHGAKVKTCSYEGCTNGRVKGEVCKRHYKLLNVVE